MKLLKKSNGFLGRYYRIVPVCKVLSPVFSVLFYLSVVLVALLAIISLIVLFVNVPAEKMLLPPHMSRQVTDAGAVYNLDLGNGISFSSPDTYITLSHIKTVIYCRLGIYAFGLIVCAPVFRFLSVLFRNIGKDEVLNEENAKYINYAGMVILFGNTLFSILRNVFNYIQISRFVEGNDVAFSFGIDLFGIVVGVFIVVLGTIYGYACSKFPKDKAAPSETTAVEKA